MITFKSLQSWAVLNKDKIKSLANLGFAPNFSEKSEANVSVSFRLRGHFVLWALFGSEQRHFPHWVWLIFFTFWLCFWMLIIILFLDISLVRVFIISQSFIKSEINPWYRVHHQWRWRRRRIQESLLIFNIFLIQIFQIFIIKSSPWSKVNSRFIIIVNALKLEISKTLFLFLTWTSARLIQLTLLLLLNIKSPHVPENTTEGMRVGRSPQATCRG